MGRGEAERTGKRLCSQCSCKEPCNKLAIFCSSNLPCELLITVNSLLIILYKYWIIFNIIIINFCVVALVPEAPINLQVTAESTTSIRVTWDSPEETNGPIVTYKVGLLQPDALSLTKEVMN